AIALAVWSCASGAAGPLAQTALVDARPDDRARTLTRWTLWSVAGDIAAPLALAAFAALGLSWRASFATVAALLAIWTVALAMRPLPAAHVEGPAEDRVSTWQALRAALRDRVLIAWLFGVALCDLLDEILVVFASLHVRIELGASPAWQAAILASFMLGSAGGLVAIDRLLACRSDRGLLVACGIACAACYALWLAAPALWLSAVLALPVGATAAPLYPLAAARAYARCPGRSTIVLVGQHLFTPLGLALPPLLGLVADHAGTHVALALLIVQPIALAVLAAATRR
ncbi:MAG TPA: MFS transporter, partial [Kofleriaceae bacterium]|nr:MFS transporter [Kofleriaceae bacterium]